MGIRGEFVSGCCLCAGDRCVVVFVFVREREKTLYSSVRMTVCERQ